MIPAFPRALVLACLAAAVTGGCASRCAVQKDETAELFPVFAHKTASGQWEVPVHGRIYRPAGGASSGALSLLKTALTIPEGGESILLFARRAEAFVVSAPSGRNVRVRLGDTFYKASDVDAGGHFERTLEIPAPRVVGVTAARYEVTSCEGERGGFSGDVFFLEEQGFSVISTVEGTIQVASVTNRGELVKDLLFREYRAVPGMANLFDLWRSSGASFHYVALMPWQLYPSLSEFMQASGYPAGSVHMRRWGDTDGSVMERIENLASVFNAGPEQKTARISELLEEFPRRRFVLVGDTAGQDPAVFAALLKRYPDRIDKVYLRDEGLDRSTDRARAALREAPEEQWVLFSHPKELMVKADAGR